MGTCTVCNREFEDKYFDSTQDKCILHCEKDVNNGWYTLNEEKIWNEDKVNSFWRYIQNDLDDKNKQYNFDSDLIDKEYILSSVVFPKFQDEVEYCHLASNEDELGTNFYSFDVFEHRDEQAMPEVNMLFNILEVSFEKCIFLDIANFKNYNFKYPITFEKCVFNNEVLLKKTYENSLFFRECDFKKYNLDLRESIFKNSLEIINCKNIKNLDLNESTIFKKTKIQNSDMEEANFYNTKFKDLADFYRTKFNKVLFEKTDFEKVSVFAEAEFNKDVDYKYTKFLGKSIFRDMVIKGKLNLRDSIFDDDATFLDITSEQREKDQETQEFYGEPKVIQVANRETARIIKNFYDNSNNIIEANKFYTLEMKEREKELNQDIKKGKNIFEWLIFKIHGKSSNHSQDWMLPVLWILNIALIYSMCISTFWHNNMLSIIQVMVIIGLFFINSSTLLKIILSINLVIFLPLSHISLDAIANKINPFSIMIGSEKITFGLLVLKITIAYLIYQSIVSVRQNTRRK